MGFSKFRPIVSSKCHKEEVDIRMFLRENQAPQQCLPVWFIALQHSFNRAMILDRHFLYDIETNVCIASLPGEFHHSVDSYRLVLAQRFGQNLNFRELPVSLLRLYFCGQQQFKNIIRRITVDNKRELMRLCQTTALTEALSYMIDYTFCSFERTLEKVLYSRETNELWYDTNLCEAIQTSPYWNSLSIPLNVIMSKHAILYTLLWRMNSALILEKLVMPWHDETSKAFFLYRIQLYRDTHMDLLAVIVKEVIYDDLRVSKKFLPYYYPASNRVCCIEELPDLSSFIFDNFKTGTHLKERTTLLDMIGHYSSVKSFNNICKDRNWWEIICTYGEKYPFIYEHVKFCIKCVLLGNLPNALGELNVMARVRIHISFWPEYIDQILTRDEIDRMMTPSTNPYIVAAKKREKKLAKETAKKHGAKKMERVMKKFDDKEAAKMNYKKTRFKMWLIKCRYFASSLMKEVLFYTHESVRITDEYLRLDVKWIQYKNIIRVANGQCRNELSRQAREKNMNEAFDWSTIEHIEKTPDDRYDLKKGIIMLFHTAALKVTKKVMKRNFIGIIEVKSTGMEEKMDITRFDNMSPIYCDKDTPDRKKMTLDELHFMCYCMAIDNNPILKTSMFKMMGMSEKGVLTIREWLLDYYIYDRPDDSFKKDIDVFQKHNIQDYVIMKTAFVLIKYYMRTTSIFHLPIDVALRQTYALRRHQMSISDWAPTPQHLGTYYRCHGCLRFANSIITPCDYQYPPNYNELSCTRHRIYNGLSPKCMNNILLYEGKYARILEHHSYANHRQDMEASQTTTTTTITKSDNISYLNIAAYDPVDHRAYCVRSKKRKRNQLNQHMDNHNENSIVIMRTTDNTTTLTRSRIKQTVLDTISDEVDDEIERDIEEEEEEDDITNMIIDDVTSLTKNNLEQIEKYIGNTKNISKSSKENNKKIIFNITNEPLRKYYHCQIPMQAVNMAGLVVDNHTLCVDCGIMTEYRDYNYLTYGPNCMRHQSHEIMKHHPIYHNHDATSSQTHKRRPLHQRLLLKANDQCRVCRKTDANFILVIFSVADLGLKPVSCCSVCYTNLTRNRTGKPLLHNNKDIEHFTVGKNYPVFSV